MSFLPPNQQCGVSKHWREAVALTSAWPDPFFIPNQTADGGDIAALHQLSGAVKS